MENPYRRPCGGRRRLLLDWEHQAVDVSVPNHFQSEVISAFLRAYRRDRITADEAREAIRDLLALPFVLCDVALLAERAFAMAQPHQQRAYDCLYVALAERDGVELWTGDERLYNALHVHYPLCPVDCRLSATSLRMRMRDRHNIHRHNVALPTTHPPLALGWSGSRTDRNYKRPFLPTHGPP